MHYILYPEVGMFVGLTVRNTASTGSGASDVKLLAAGECRRISDCRIFRVKGLEVFFLPDTRSSANNA